MSAWGPEAFANDDAQDWELELVGSDNLDAVDNALARSLTGSGFLEAPHGARAVAASEALAALKGLTSPLLPEQVRVWAERNSSLDATARLVLALRAIDRVMSPDSELFQLWSEDQRQFEEWKAEIDDLRHRLQAQRGPACHET